MRRIVLACLVACTSLVLVPAPSYACSCADISVEQSFRNSDVVLTGQVDAVIEPPWRPGERTLRVQVDRVFKGEVPEWVDVDSGGPCGIDYPLQGQTAFFLQRNNGNLYASLCGGTGGLPSEQVTTLLVEGASPQPGGPGPHTGLSEYAAPLAVAGGLALSFLVGLLWWRLARS